MVKPTFTDEPKMFTNPYSVKLTKEEEAKELYKPKESENDFTTQRKASSSEEANLKKSVISSAGKVLQEIPRQLQYQKSQPKS